MTIWIQPFFVAVAKDRLFECLLHCFSSDSTLHWLFQVQRGCEMPSPTVLQAEIHSRYGLPLCDSVTWGRTIDYLKLEPSLHWGASPGWLPVAMVTRLCMDWLTGSSCEQLPCFLYRKTRLLSIFCTHEPCWRGKCSGGFKNAKFGARGHFPILYLSFILVFGFIFLSLQLAKAGGWTVSRESSLRRVFSSFVRTAGVPVLLRAVMFLALQMHCWTTCSK